MYSYAENIANKIREAGYKNKILVNKHSQSDDWERHQSNAPSLDYYGHHAYFNNLNDPSTHYNTLWGQQDHMDNAKASDCNPIINTEIGAHFKEFSECTTENVEITNRFLHWSNERKIGNLLWLNHNVRNLATYEALGFDPQWNTLTAETTTS
jgi:hypothetical protein